MITSIRLVSGTLSVGSQLSFTAAFLQNNKPRRRARGQEVGSDFILKSEKISESFQQMKATRQISFRTCSRIGIVVFIIEQKYEKELSKVL